VGAAAGWDTRLQVQFEGSSRWHGEVGGLGGGLFGAELQLQLRIYVKELGGRGGSGSWWACRAAEAAQQALQGW
jgi:hypothetical protein